ncbi:GNAT family N-acetyltransferase [Isoptericola sp. F-RaC21]|uniref:GNAT family N-acetyltransferase n=1 Tax=Isoptericola sp. F-RaC21 TaxID=3141452 RepID=UPI00315B8BAC
MTVLTPGEREVPTWQLTEDAQAFLDAVGGVLAADPVRSTIVANTARRLAEQAAEGRPRPDHPCWFAVARAPGGEVVGVAMRTAPAPPHQAHVLLAERPLAEGLADLLLGRGEVVTATNGAQEPARAFLERVAARTGGRVAVARPTRLFELGGLVAPSPLPDGAPRAIRHDEVDLAHRWFVDFVTDAERQAGRSGPPRIPPPGRELVERRVGAGKFWWWEVDAAPVSLVGHVGPALDVARLGPVFTPAEHRGRGYAGALVAHVSTVLRDAGNRVCLFTDLENPVSNALYERLGYRPVVDMAELRIVP